MSGALAALALALAMFLQSWLSLCFDYVSIAAIGLGLSARRSWVKLARDHYQQSLDCRSLYCTIWRRLAIYRPLACGSTQGCGWFRFSWYRVEQFLNFVDSTQWRESHLYSGMTHQLDTSQVTHRFSYVPLALKATHMRPTHCFDRLLKCQQCVQRSARTHGTWFGHKCRLSTGVKASSSQLSTHCNTQITFAVN